MQYHVLKIIKYPFNIFLLYKAFLISILSLETKEQCFQIKKKNAVKYTKNIMVVRRNNNWSSFGKINIFTKSNTSDRYSKECKNGIRSHECHSQIQCLS